MKTRVSIYCISNFRLPKFFLQGLVKSFGINKEKLAFGRLDLHNLSNKASPISGTLMDKDYATMLN